MKQVYEINRLTDVVLLNFVDVAVNRRVAKEDQHHRLAAGQLHHVGGVALQGVRRRRGRFPWQPGASGDVEHPHFVRHVGCSSFHFPAKQVDVILQKKRVKIKAFLLFTFVDAFGAMQLCCFLSGVTSKHPVSSTSFAIIYIFQPCV